VGIVTFYAIQRDRCKVGLWGLAVGAPESTPRPSLLGGSYPRPCQIKMVIICTYRPDDNGYHLQLNANDNYYYL